MMPPKYGADPASSSSDEEDEHEVAPPPNPKPKSFAAAAATSSSSDEDESSSSGEEEEVAPPPLNPKPTTAAKPASSSDEDESSSSDDDAPPASKPVPAPSATPANPIPATPSTTKSKAFQRTWTDKDEIALLQGMLLYQASNGVVVSTNSDMKLFHQFIRGSLQIEVRPSQLFDRVRRFKAKYQKTRDRGESPSSAKPHDAAIYELSRKIWGTERVKLENGNAKESRAANRAAKRHKGHRISNGAEEKNGDTAVVQVRYPYLADAVSRMGASALLNEVIGLVDHSEAMALDKRHKKLVMMQVDLTNDTAALIKKATESMC